MKRILGNILAASAIGVCPDWLAAQEETKKPEAKPVEAKQSLFSQLDKNGDGQITADEVPEDKKSYFDRILKNNDKNADGKVNAEELAAGTGEGKPRRPEGNPEPPAGQPRRPGVGGNLPDPGVMFKQLDANNDGKLVPDEIPAERRERFASGLSRADKDGDGGLNLDEYREMFKAMMRAGGGTPPGAPGQGQRPGMGQAPFFRALDADGDGKISNDELLSAGAALKKLDANKDGYLTQEELVPPGPPGGSPPAGLPGGAPQAAANAMRDRLLQADANKDGKISKDEAPERMKEFFGRIDRNGDGFLDQEEMSRMPARPGQAGDAKRPEAKRPKENK